MLRSFFSFVQRKALFFRSTQKRMIQALRLKGQHAALYLKYAKALRHSSPQQAAIFAAMSIQELESYKQLLCLSCSARTRTMDLFCENPSVVTRKPHNLNSRKKMTHPTTKKPTKTQKQILLTWIQPGLAGLMDGSVSTLAPIFAAAFATGDTHQTFLIGLSSSIGAGLSMGFTEAAHDDGKLSGRGSPLKRGLSSGIMTALGGLGHTLPYLIHSFYIATVTAFIIVFFELLAIVWIQHKFMSTPFWRASLQVIIGGALVFATGILIGSI
ncbi:VIT1/CCC1 family predicted Fe2+/Mn2+ transporter [Bartonella silvatica]|uniref:VIT1/CCC1 family predicted Fe2+/Mn2+ transporter n=1 Tax=Bartonella silvatica TaxID=357760 RepID=A0ABV2HH13_9HYPH